MPLMYEVPEAARRAAARALELHKAAPLPETYGVDIAGEIVKGTVTDETARRILRFNAMNESALNAEIKALRSEDDSALVRSFHLLGAEHGVTVAAMVDSGEADPDFLSMLPEEFERTFGNGAWCFEFGYDVRAAARLVEEYMRQNGAVIDLTKTFGESAEAVGNMMLRRLQVPNPLTEAINCAAIEDEDYGFAANNDLAEMTFASSPDFIDESLNWAAFSHTMPKALAKIVWAPFVAYFILAVEKPDLLTAVNKASTKPPALDHNPKMYTAYNDAVNIAIMYFHPKGKHYVSPAGNKNFEGLDAEVFDLLTRAWLGRALNAQIVKKMLGRARRWTAENGFAGSLFHVYNADWNKANWHHILSGIPVDSDIYADFSIFADEKPLPAHGVKLQQTISAADAKKEMLEYLQQQWNGYTELKQMKIGDSLFGKTCAKNGTPVGVYSLIHWGVDYVVMGVAMSPAGNIHVIVRSLSGDWNLYKDTQLAALAESGALVVKKAHYDMPGTAYAAPKAQPTPPPKPAAPAPEPVAAVPPPAAPSIPHATTVTIRPPVPSVGPNPADIKVLTPVPVTEIEKYLEETFGDAWAKFEPRDLTSTQSLAYWFKMYGEKLPVAFAEIVRKKDGKIFTLVNAYYIPNLEVKTSPDEPAQIVEDTIVVVRWPDNSLTFESDDDLKALFEQGLFEPKKPITDKALPKFTAGDLIKGPSGALYYVLAVDPHGVVYNAVWFSIAVIMPTEETIKKSLHIPNTDAKFTLVKSGVLANELNKYLSLTGKKIVEFPQEWAAHKGDFIQTTAYTGVLLAAEEIDPGVVVPVIAIIMTVEMGGVEHRVPVFVYGPADCVKPKPVSSYVPDEPKPESGFESDAPSKMCGTQDAIDKAAKLGWTMATKSENKTFEWDLGDVLAYGEKQRLIIGYAFNPAGAPIYVIKTAETGTVNFKSTPEGNKQYGPKITSDQSVINALKMKPGTTKSQFPKLNYPLLPEAKTWNQKTKGILVPSPKPAPFLVGVKLTAPSGDVYKLIGWIMVDDEACGLLLHTATGGDISVSAAALAESYSPAFHYGNSLNPSTGEVTFGKGKNAGPIGVVLNSTTFLPSKLPEGWDSPAAVEQPAVEGLPPGNHFSAGIVIVIPSAGVANGTVQFQTKHPLLVMTHPLNEYMDYKLTFPKGTVEQGESIEKAAVREVMEETGIAAVPVAFLGDFKGGNSVTRMFIGYATGGDPQKAGQETDAVTLKPLVSNDVDKLPWASLLKDRDKEITKRVIAWIERNGFPGAVKVDEADFDSQVSAPTDVAPPTFDPNAKIHSPTAGKKLASVVDYKPSAEANAWMSDVPTTWAWIAALPWMNKGFPPPATLVKVKGQGDAVFRVEGYLAQAHTGSKSACITLKNMAAGSFVNLLIDVSPPSAGVLTLPSDFAPAVTSAVKSTLNIPADTSSDEMWESLFKKASFPMTTAMVAAVKRAVATANIKPTGFETTKTKAPGPTYGTGFLTAAGKKFLAMGHVNVMKMFEVHDGSAQGVGLALQLAIDEQNDVVALPGDMAALGQYTHDFVTTDAYKVPDPWFKHPDAAVNKSIQTVYANGGHLEALGLSMKVFKEKWLKEAGIPNYAVASLTIIQDIAALFVPGAASKPMYEAVLACLKKRMQLTQKKGKGQKIAPAIDIVSDAPSVKTVPQHIIVKEPDPTSAGMQMAVEGMATTAALNVIGKVEGGSKPNMIAQDTTGQKWFLKSPLPSDKTPFRPYTDRAAFKLCALIKGNNIPVGVAMHNGTPVSIQPLIGNAEPLKEGDYAGISDIDKAEVLAQHAADMFIGDHDGHFGNWMRAPNGKLYAIDKGQAFKFILKGAEESLDPSWSAPGNFGVHLAKKLLVDWAHGTLEIPASAFTAMRDAIDRVAQITNDQLDDILGDWFMGGKLSVTDRLKVFGALKARRDGYLAAWTEVLSNLAKARGDKWKWPKETPKAKWLDAPVKAAEVLPAAKEMGFTEKHALDIAIAANAKWQGKSIRVDKDAIENQEVMVKRVHYSSTESPEKFATLIYFRVGKIHSIEAEKKLNVKAKVVSASIAGPQPLPFDGSGGGEKYWGIIQSGVKTLNHHLHDEKDGKPNPETIAKVANILPELKALVAATKDPKGKYEGVSNEAVNLMATAYVGYCDTIVSMAANAQSLIGQKTEMMYQFLWQDKPEAEPKDEDVDVGVTIKKITKSGFFPSSSPIGQEVAIKGTESPMFEPNKGYGKYKQSQFLIEVTAVPGARIYFNPSHGEGSGYEEVRTHFGQAWAVVPGAPTPTQVAAVLAAFEKATGLGMKVASADDNEVLYLSKQAFILQETTSSGLKPKGDGTGVVEPEYAAALAQYRAGKTSEAKSALRAFVGKKLGVDPGKLESVPGWNPEPEHARGAGFGRHLRLGWTRQKLAAFLGQDVFVVHHISGTISNFFQTVTAHNGALVANAVKPFYGVPIGGTGSPDADFVSGGAANLFAVLRKGFLSQGDLLYFDVSILLRTDVYIIGSSDSFGRDTETRYLRPETWKDHNLHKSTSGVSTGSPWQVNIRHDADLQHYLHTAIFESAKQRDAAREACKKAGWLKFANGRTLEQVIVSRGEEKL